MDLTSRPTKHSLNGVINKKKGVFVCLSVMRMYLLFKTHLTPLTGLSKRLYVVARFIQKRQMRRPKKYSLHPYHRNLSFCFSQPTSLLANPRLVTTPLPILLLFLLCHHNHLRNRSLHLYTLDFSGHVSVRITPLGLPRAVCDLPKAVCDLPKAVCVLRLVFKKKERGRAPSIFQRAPSERRASMRNMKKFFTLFHLYSYLYFYHIPLFMGLRHVIWDNLME